MTKDDRTLSDDELLERIQRSVEILARDPPPERHERANLAYQIVLCASVLHKRLKEREQV